MSPEDLLTAAKLNAEAFEDLRFLYSKPRCRAYRDSDTSVSNQTNVTLQLNAERWDSDNMHSNSTNPSRITCVTAGQYLVGAHVQFPANTSGTRELLIIINGVGIIAGMNAPGNSEAGFETSLTAMTSYVLSVGDYVEARVRQNSGGTLVIPGSGSGSLHRQELWASWISG